MKASRYFYQIANVERHFSFALGQTANKITSQGDNQLEMFALHFDGILSLISFFLFSETK